MAHITGTNDSDSEAHALRGTAGNDLIEGLGGADDLYGGDGDDVLDGGTGADRMAGGTGNDTYIVNNIADMVTELSGGGHDTIDSSVTYTLSANVEKLVLTGSNNISAFGNSGGNNLVGNAGNNTLWGGDGNDTLSGGLGSDMLDGGKGADTMNGGAGDDIYLVDNAADSLVEAAGDGHDTVRTAITYTLADNIEDLVITGTGDRFGTGNALNNHITGNAGSNTLGGADGNDVIDGGRGADLMRGGLGDDTFYVDNIGDVVAEYTNAGNDTVYSSINFTLGNNVENLTLTATQNLHATGNALDNHLTGNSGNNSFDGRAGADLMAGGLGNDSYYVDNESDVAVEEAGAGADTVFASVNFTLGANIETLVLTGAGDISGTGNDLDNVLKGNSGANLLTGGDGNDSLYGAAGDTLVGGQGNDAYYVASPFATIVEAANTGLDQVYSSSDYTLSDNLENITLTGTADINATGNSLANSLVGNSGNNRLDGGAGADLMAGGAGDDTYVLDIHTDHLFERAGEGTDTEIAAFSAFLPNNVENLTLSGDGNFTGFGNQFDNVIIGNDGNNKLNGGDGSDTLFGGKGDDLITGFVGLHDVMAGGDGADRFLCFVSQHDTVLITDYSASEGDTLSFSFEENQPDHTLHVSQVGDDTIIVIQQTTINVLNTNMNDIIYHL